jgi:hypothetical protein
MRLIVAALAAAAAFGAATAPAAACGFFNCANLALADDAYPPGIPLLDPQVQQVVLARDGTGLSTAGYYNDPTLTLARREYASRSHDAPPPSYEPAGYGERSQEGGPEVVLSPYAHHGYGHRHSSHRHRNYAYVK